MIIKAIEINVAIPLMKIEKKNFMKMFVDSRSSLKNNNFSYHYPDDLTEERGGVKRETQRDTKIHKLRSKEYKTRYSHFKIECPAKNSSSNL